MGLLGNQHRNNFGGVNSQCDALSRTNGNYSMYGCFLREAFEDFATADTPLNAMPVGSYPPRSFFPPTTVGQMSARMTGSGTITVQLFADRLMVAELFGDGSLSADLALAVGMLCNLTGSGSLTADIVGTINGAIDFTGTGGLSASIRGDALATANLTGTGGLSADIHGIGDMSIDIIVEGTGLTTANVGQAVWSAIAANNNVAGTMGEKLNLAGSGGVDYDALKQAIWEAVLGDYSTDPSSAAAIVEAINTFTDELHKARGLDASNPATQTPTTLDAGSIHVDVTGDGITTTTFTRS
jgi:hypothetical protein